MPLEAVERFPDRVERLFHEARELPTASRGAFLLQACDGDPGLYAAVGKLLEAAARVDRKPAWDNSAIQNEAREAAAALGDSTFERYRLMECVGSGGMGVVYKALRADEEFSKLVAIKIVQHGADERDHVAVLQRFRQERQILAGLEHPNIARLLDGGSTPEGLPFLVMEYVDGDPIDRYLAQRKTPERETLELFRTLCSAVSYAHRKLIVHRDLKPANILVNAGGTPKLLDFGIAKLLDGSTAKTNTGAGALTPEYASPEQVRGETVTTSTDVYSLGVLLYELLCGARPYRATGSILELAQAICLETPSPMAARSGKRIGADLENIVQKALRKEADRRYASVEQFSEDIRRYLEGRPVQARGDAPLYLARKFVQRNWVAMAAAMAILCTLIVGLVEVTRARARAERRFNEVRQLAHSVMFDYSDAIDRLPGATPVRARLVRDALRYLDNLSKEADTPALQQEIVDAYVRVSNVQGNEYQNNLGDTAGALNTAGKAAAAAENLVDRKTPSALSSAAEAFAADASLLYSAGDLPGADRQYRRAIELRARIRHGSPGDVDNNLALATYYRHMGDLYGGYGFHNLGRTVESVKFYRTARDIVFRLEPNGPNKIDVTKARYKSLMSLSVSEGSIGRREEAARDLAEALSQVETLNAAEPDDANVKIELANMEQRFGQSLIDGRRAPEAISHMARSAGILAGLAAADPANAMYRRSWSVVETQWAAALRGAGQAPAAIEHNRQALTMAEALGRESPQSAQYRADIGVAERKLSESLFAGGDPRGALQHAEAARKSSCSAAESAPDSFTRANCGRALVVLGNALTGLNRFQPALQAYRSAERYAQDVSHSDPLNSIFRSDLARSEAALAGSLVQSGETKAAAKMYRDSLANWSLLRNANSLTAEDARRSDETALRMAALAVQP